MRDSGFWDPASLSRVFLLKLFLSSDPDSFISGTACVSEIVPSKTHGPKLHQ